MSKRLGYTWWPKDWAASQKVQSMNIIERGIYRELIDLVMDAEGAIPVNKTLWCRLWRISETELTKALEYLIELGAVELHGVDLWIPSCEPRMEKALSKRDTARENGAKGGRPRKTENNPNKTQTKPSGFTTETTTETTTEKPTDFLKVGQSKDAAHIAIRVTHKHLNEQGYLALVDAFYIYAQGVAKAWQNKRETQAHFVRWACLQKPETVKQHEPKREFTPMPD